MKKMLIYLDFDGTCVVHAYPNIGKYNPGCLEVIKKLQDAGHDIILNTMRSEFNNGSLEQALNWFDNAWFFTKNDDFNLKPIKSTDKKYHPCPWNWETFFSNNIVMIDDISLGIPLIKSSMNNSMMVDWSKIDKEFEQNGLYEKCEE